MLNNFNNEGLTRDNAACSQEEFDAKRESLVKQLKQTQLLKNLGKRELECLCLRINSRKAWEVAEVLGISKRTVDIHFHHTSLKLGQPLLSEVSDRLREIGARPLVDELCKLLCDKAKMVAVA
jgi:FixJ family two-component response regulator